MQGGCCLPPSYDFVPLAIWTMHALSMWIPCGHLGQGPLTTPATSPACLPDECTTISILHIPWGRVWGYWASKFVRGYSPLLHQPGTSPPHPRAPGVGAPVVGDTLTALLLPPTSTNWNHPASCLQSPRSARTSGGLWPSSISFWALIRGWEGPTLCKGYTPPLSARGMGVPKAWHCLGIFPSSFQGLGSLVSTTSWSPVTSTALAAAQVLVAEGMAHPFHFLLWYGHSHQGVLVGVPCKNQYFLTWIPLHGSKLLICSAVCGSKFSLGIGCVIIDQSPFLLCLWQCRWLIMLEAFFHGVQDFLVNVLFCPLFTASPPRQPLQLIDVPLELCYLLPGGVRADELHGSRSCPQVSFHWWFPSALEDCMVMLTPASSSGMGEHCWYKNSWWSLPGAHCQCSLR